MCFNLDLRLKNTGTQPIVAFEIVILKYDAFYRRELGTRWTITGKNSGDWSPLEAGASDGDGTREYGGDDIYTAIAYVRNIRFADMTLWEASDATLQAGLRKLNSGIKEFGDVKPDPKRARTPPPTP